jgi:hypothetical protein
MLSCNRVLPGVVAVVLALCAPVWAQEAAEEKPEAPQATVAPEQIAALVKQLDSDRFAERQAATDKLAEIGKPAIDALSEAAAGQSLEVTVRSIDVLKKLAGSSDEPTKEAAKAALEKIAGSSSPAAARRAQEALKAMEEAEQRQQRNVMVPGLIQGGIQIAVAGGGAARRMSVKTVNGVKTIEAEEGDRKIKIVDDPNAGIKMEVTTKKDGKETTEKYEAKDADDLKKKHPEAHKIYNEYAKNAGQQLGRANIRVLQGQAIRLGAANQIDRTNRILQSWIVQLERLTSDEAIKQASAESRQELKKKAGELKKKLGDLEARLDKAMEKAEKKSQ